MLYGLILWVRPYNNDDNHITSLQGKWYIHLLEEKNVFYRMPTRYRLVPKAQVSELVSGRKNLHQNMSGLKNSMSPVLGPAGHMLSASVNNTTPQSADWVRSTPGDPAVTSEMDVLSSPSAESCQWRTSQLGSSVLVWLDVDYWFKAVGCLFLLPTICVTIFVKTLLLGNKSNLQAPNFTLNIATYHWPGHKRHQPIQSNSC